MNKQKSTCGSNDAGLTIPESMLLRNWKIDLISSIVLSGFVISVFYHYILAGYFGLPYPYNTFLANPKIRFGDYINDYRISVGLNPYFSSFWLHSNYYPFMNVFMYFFTLIPIKLSILLFLIIFGSFFTWFNYAHLKSDNRLATFKNVFIFSFMTYPFLILVDRLNLEGWVFIFLGTFIFLYHKKQYTESAVFLALATCMKLSPLVFILMFLADKRYREIIIIIAVVFSVSLISLLLLHGNFFDNLSFILNGFHLDKEPTIQPFFDYSNNLIQRGVSLFTFLKVIFNTTWLLDFLRVKSLLSMYVKTMLILSCLMAFFVIFIEKTQWKRAAIIVLMLVLFPHISADYKLIHLFLPLALYINHNEKSPRDKLYCVLFGFMMVPKCYMFISSMVSDVGHDVSISVPINIATLLFLMGLLIYDGLFSEASKLERPSIKEQFREHLAAFKSQIGAMLPGFMR